jgi:hypothetical protein
MMLLLGAQYLGDAEALEVHDTVLARPGWPPAAAWSRLLVIIGASAAANPPPPALLLLL